MRGTTARNRLADLLELIPLCRAPHSHEFVDFGPEGLLTERLSQQVPQLWRAIAQCRHLEFGPLREQGRHVCAEPFAQILRIALRRSPVADERYSTSTP